MSFAEKITLADRTKGAALSNILAPVGADLIDYSSAVKDDPRLAVKFVDVFWDLYTSKVKQCFFTLCQ